MDDQTDRMACHCQNHEDVKMPQTPHVEKHFTASESVRDIVIGMSDGLTVPFALAAGLSGAVESSGIIVTAGLAEVAAGAIATRRGIARPTVRRRRSGALASTTWDEGPLFTPPSDTGVHALKIHSCSPQPLRLHPLGNTFPAPW